MNQPRSVHIMGSMPPDVTSADEAMRLTMASVGSCIRMLPDGETSRAGGYVKPIVEGLVEHPAVRKIKQGDWSSLRARTMYRVRKGHSLREASLERHLGYFRDAEKSWPVFRRIRDEHPSLLFQAGVPGPFELAVVAFGIRGLAQYRPFAEATIVELKRIHELAGDDVVFQLELPGETVLAAALPPGLRLVPIDMIARAVRNLVSSAPRGSRFGVHLCYGSLNDTPAIVPRTTAAVVRLANAVSRHWPDGRSLEFVHIPMAAGDHPPLRERYYAPLRRLSLRPPARFVAGLVHEKQPFHEQQRALGLVEAMIGHRVDIAHACGFGQRPDKDAVRVALQRAVALAGT